MARRLSSDTLGGSRKWAALTCNTNRMLYDRAIDITDPYGRFDADPIMFRARAVPRLEISIDEVAAALDDMEAVGLIERWEVDGNAYAYIVDFEKYNKPDPAKEAQTRIPGPDGVIPTKPGRTDRNASKKAKGKPKPDPTPDVGKPRARSGQAQGAPRARVGLEVGTLDVDVDEDKRVLTDVSGKGITSQSVMSAHADPTRQLVEIWNEERGQLRAVRDVDVALANPEVTRLTTSLLKRHGPRAVEIFRAGIAAVRTDPHWLGSRATKRSRDGPPYGIANYLRHVETKYDAALDQQPAPPEQLDVREGDTLQHLTTQNVDRVESVSNGIALMRNGESWPIGECMRCNN